MLVPPQHLPHLAVVTGIILCTIRHPVQLLQPTLLIIITAAATHTPTTTSTESQNQRNGHQYQHYCRHPTPKEDAGATDPGEDTYTQDVSATTRFVQANSEWFQPRRKIFLGSW